MWKKILKFEIRNVKDAVRAGKEYALEDYYESMLMSEEEYQNLSMRERRNLHQRLYLMLKKYGKNSWAEKTKQFHSAMQGRAENRRETTMLPTENYKPRPRRPKEVIEAERREKQQRREERQQRREERERAREERRQRRPPTTTEREQRMEERKTRSKMIIDYFTMWRNMYNRFPTLTEITNSEGRPLTVDEKEPLMKNTLEEHRNDKYAHYRKERQVVLGRTRPL